MHSCSTQIPYNIALNANIHSRLFHKKQPGVLINRYLAESEHQLEGQRSQVELSPGTLSVPS